MLTTTFTEFNQVEDEGEKRLIHLDEVAVKDHYTKQEYDRRSAEIFDWIREQLYLVRKNKLSNAPS